MKLSTVFINKINELIEKQGISARKLSLRAGLSPAAVTKMLKPGTSPSLDSANAIANAFGMSLAQLLGDAGKEHELEECYRRVHRDRPSQRTKG